MNKEQQALLGIPDLTFERIHANAIDTLEENLEKAKIVPSAGSGIRDWKRWQKNMDQALVILRKQQKERLLFQEEFAREFVEANKIDIINTGGPKRRLQSVSFTMGQQREQELTTQDTKKKRKKAKMGK